jgi:hypothetical protein
MKESDDASSRPDQKQAELGVRVLRQVRSAGLERIGNYSNLRGFFAVDSLQKQQTLARRFAKWL